VPDLLTHCLVGYGLARPRITRPLAYVFLVGAVLPDVCTRAFCIVWPNGYFWVMPLHTPLGVAVLCGVLAQCFRAGERGRVFVFLAAGAGLHLLLDASQRHVAGGYTFLFPFSWATYKGGVWWPEDSLLLLPFLLALLVVVETGLYRRRRRKRTETPQTPV